MRTRLREKGQVTIPVALRRSLGLKKDAILSVVSVGDAIFLTQKELVFDDVSGKFARSAEEAGISLDSLLEDLREARSHKKR